MLVSVRPRVSSLPSCFRLRPFLPSFSAPTRFRGPHRDLPHHLRPCPVLPWPHLRVSPLRCLCGPASQGILLRAALPPQYYTFFYSGLTTTVAFCLSADDSTPPFVFHCHQKNPGLVGRFLGGLALIVSLWLWTTTPALFRPLPRRNLASFCVALSTDYDHRLPRH